MWILGDLLGYSSPGPLRSPGPPLVRGKEVGYEMKRTRYFWALFWDCLIHSSLDASEVAHLPLSI